MTKDLTNYKFGKLTALYPIKIKGKRYWHCKCDCGNECDILTASLTTGNTKSCGCYRANLMSTKNRKDLTRQTFGELTVIKDSGERQNRNILWICECSCGNVVKVQGTALLSGHTKSCGCIKSRGELKINNILFQTNDILYTTQEKFQDCVVNSNQMPFDFAIYDRNHKLLCLIEYDGDIHFQYRETGWNTKENFLQRVYNDQLKNKYCIEHHIQLYRIPYYDLNKINTFNDIIQKQYLVKNINHYNINILKKDV